MNRDEQESRNTYEQLFIALSTKVEKVLIRFLLVFLLLLLGSQALLQIPLMRAHLTKVEPLEGKPYAEHARSLSGPRSSLLPKWTE
jgi:hypothetical protein